MFTRRIKIFDLFGIPIYLDSSLIILLLIFATSGGGLTAGIVAAVGLLLSITAHELGHALTARCFGYETNDITLSLLGGCASLIALPRKAWQEFLTAIAGPLVSFLLAIIAFVGMGLIANEGNVFVTIWHAFTGNLPYVWVGKSVKYLYNEEVILSVSRQSFMLFDRLFDFGCMNLMLGLFNLLPGFPLDGGRVFRSAMRAFMDRARATYIAMLVGRGVAILLGIVAVYRILNGGHWGFVTLLIAWMIWREGYREYTQSLYDSRWDYSARVSPPPYGGDEDEVEIRR